MKQLPIELTAGAGHLVKDMSGDFGTMLIVLALTLFVSALIVYFVNVKNEE